MTVPESSVHSIIIAEDDPDDRLMVRDALERCETRYVLRFAENGADLLDMLRHAGAFANTPLSPPPGLILLDLNMPKVTGLEALRAIKADVRLSAIPVVIWTTSQSAVERDASYRDGAAQFLTKPDLFKEMERALCEIAHTWLHRAP